MHSKRGVMKSLYLSLIGLMVFGWVATALAQGALPKPDAPFKGKIAPRFEDSTPDWPVSVAAPAGAPNVLVWMADDTGFGQYGSFGGLIDTPTIDQLAANGLRYTNFNTTTLCSPTRAAFVTGRNSHTVGFGSHAISAMGFPGYNGFIPQSAATFYKTLQLNGYTTFASGKWDHTPIRDLTIAGPFDRWPTGQGFDHYYGFMAADTDQFQPPMWMNHTPVDPSKGKPDYHLTTDMADKAIEWVTAMRSNAPGRPWAMYWATGANHAPHQSPKAWRDKYKGRFDMGYDKAREMVLANQKKLGIVPPDTVLTARPQDIPAWDSLSAEQKKLYARQMEAFAAQLSHADYEFGRIIDALDRTGQLENTIVIVFPDNGASAEGDRGGTYNEFRFANGVPTSDAQNMKYYDSWGGPATFNHYAAGWAMAGNTPFRYSKQMVHPGGTRDPLVISWPKGIKDKGGIRTQFTHVIDIGPTVLAAAGVAQPTEVNGIKQIPYDGAAFNATFDDPQAKTRSTQYFEMYGNRSLYKDGWLAVTLHAQRQPWDLAKRAPFEDDVWELYNLNEDFSGARDVAALYPDKLKELQQVWDVEARKYNVYPLYDDFAARIDDVKRRFVRQTDRFEFYPPGAYRLAEDLAPPTKNRAHTITAEIVVPAGGAEGVLVAQSGHTAGWVLYAQDNRLVYEYNFFGDYYRALSDQPPPEDKASVAMKFVKTGNLAGRAELYVNGKLVGQGEIPRTVAIAFGVDETFDVGQDTATAVSEHYKGAFPFNGEIDKVTVTLDDKPDPQAPTSTGGKAVID